MAVRKDSEEEGEAKYTITNGDLEALNRVKEQYNLRDSDDVLTFAIGVLSQSGGRPITVQSDQSIPVKLLPSDQLRRNEDDQETNG